MVFILGSGHVGLGGSIGCGDCGEGVGFDCGYFVSDALYNCLWKYDDDIAMARNDSLAQSGSCCDESRYAWSLEEQQNGTFLYATDEYEILLFASHHLCQIFKGTPPLVDNLIESVRRTNRSNDDLVASRGEAFARFIHVLADWHTELSPLLRPHVVVQFRLWKSAHFIAGI